MSSKVIQKPLTEKLAHLSIYSFVSFAFEIWVLTPDVHISHDYKACTG
jgi:hypothetical protein